MKSLKKRGAVTMQHRFPITAALCSALMLAGCDTEPPTSPDQQAPTLNQSVVPCPASGFCVADAAPTTVAEPSTLEYATSAELSQKLTEVSELSALSSTSSTAWVVGDVFAAVSSGRYQVYSNAGVFKETIVDGNGVGFTTGCAFNPTLDRLYTTNFSNTKVYAFDDASPHSILQTIDTNIKSPNGHSESIVFAADGSFYVGHPDGNDDIHHYDAAGTFLAQFDAAIIGRGTDWIDLATDQRTMLYTSESGVIRRYDVVADAQLLPDFASIGSISYALRLLPPGDGTGGLLVANTGDVKRLDGAGAVVQTYDASGENSWFALNLDPNGTSFWAANFGTANFYRFNIASGAVEVGPINTGTGPTTLFGLCLKGEPTAGVPTENIEKVLLEGPEQIGIYELEPTEYVFEIDYTGPAAQVQDAVPAEFVVLSANASDGAVNFFESSKGKGKSATQIRWDAPAGSNTLTVTIQTVVSPGKRNNKKDEPPVFKPTSCGPLPINDGATAFEVDEDGALVLVEVVDSETGEVTLEPVVIVGPSNSLEVEAVEGTKPCEEG